MNIPPMKEEKGGNSSQSSFKENQNEETDGKKE
jgi:hypothetical protein